MLLSLQNNICFGAEDISEKMLREDRNAAIAIFSQQCPVMGNVLQWCHGCYVNFVMQLYNLSTIACISSRKGRLYYNVDQQHSSIVNPAITQILLEEKRLCDTMRNNFASEHMTPVLQANRYFTRDLESFKQSDRSQGSDFSSKMSSMQVMLTRYFANLMRVHFMPEVLQKRQNSFTALQADVQNIKFGCYQNYQAIKDLCLVDNSGLYRGITSSDFEKFITQKLSEVTSSQEFEAQLDTVYKLANAFDGARQNDAINNRFLVARYVEELAKLRKIFESQQRPLPALSK